MLQSNENSELPSGNRRNILAQNRAAAEIILQDIQKYGGPDSLPGEWARRVLKTSTTGDSIPCQSSGRPGAAEDSRQDSDGVGVGDDTHNPVLVRERRTDGCLPGRTAEDISAENRDARLCTPNPEAGLTPARQHQICHSGLAENNLPADTGDAESAASSPDGGAVGSQDTLPRLETVGPKNNGLLL